MAYSPAFQVYYKDFRQDPKTIAMDATEIGAYWLLIMECWDRDNSLPTDIEELALIARTPLKRFQKIWDTKIRRCFQFDTDSQLFWHKRLAAEIRKQEGWSKDQSERGKLGAEKRWAEYRKNKGKNGDAKAPPSPGMAPDGSSSSSSSSSSSEEVDTTALAVHTGTVLAGITEVLGIQRLSPTKQKEFEDHAHLAFINGFTATQFIDCFRDLKETKHYSIKPEYVTDRLPEFVPKKEKKTTMTARDFAREAEAQQADGIQ